MNKVAVKNALELVDKSCKDELFKKWIEDNQGSLDSDYDQYGIENFEDHKNFITWALRQYIYT